MLIRSRGPATRTSGERWWEGCVRRERDRCQVFQNRVNGTRLREEEEEEEIERKNGKVVNENERTEGVGAYMRVLIK